MLFEYFAAHAPLTCLRLLIFRNFLLARTTVARTDGYPLSLDVFVFCLLLWFTVKNCFITLLQVRRRDIFTTIYSKPVDGVAQW